MKTILILLLFLFSISLFAQDAKEILKKANAKCFSIQNGYYEMTRRMKFMERKDTATITYSCYFKKLSVDTLYTSAFNYKSRTVYKGQEIIKNTIYTGNEIAMLNAKDSSATIMSKDKWAADIVSFRHNILFYAPLTQKAKEINAEYPLPHDSDFTDNKHTLKFLGEDKINNNACYHIQVNLAPEKCSAEDKDMKELRREYHFWIKKDDFLPIQYSEAYDMLMDNDTMYQYEEMLLTKYELNNLTDETPLTLKSIPAWYRLKDYVPYKGPDLLPKDSIAPGWNLVSVKDEKISLNNLKGQLVLIDFFYKACYPCMQALPFMQALHEKYKNKGLNVIGIDPFDKKEDDMQSFLTKRGVAYTVLLDGAEAAKEYRVSGYPTMYLIDRIGKVIYTQEGYGKDTEDTLEEIIKKNL